MGNIVIATVIISGIILLFSSSSFAQVSSPAYTNVTASHVMISPPGDLLNFEITTEAEIPHAADSYIDNTLAFGYAWLDSILFPTNGVVATLHPNMTDASEYPNLWHLHEINVDQDGCVTALEELPAAHSLKENIISIYVSGSLVSISPSTFQSGTSFQFITNNTACPAPLSGLVLVM